MKQHERRKINFQNSLWTLWPRYRCVGSMAERVINLSGTVTTTTSLECYFLLQPLQNIDKYKLKLKHNLFQCQFLWLLSCFLGFEYMFKYSDSKNCPHVSHFLKDFEFAHSLLLIIIYLWCMFCSIRFQLSYKFSTL